jgi:hypothetical protein
MIQDWSENTTLNAEGACTVLNSKKATPSSTAWDKGHPQSGSTGEHVPGSAVLPGSLFNAMVLPWVNYTIRGALWCVE